MFDWSTVYLSDVLHTGEGLAAAGFAAFLCCMALGRVVGDSLVERFGSVAVVRGTCLLAALCAPGTRETHGDEAQSHLQSW